jgi:hypothetical protein
MDMRPSCGRRGYIANAKRGIHLDGRKIFVPQAMMVRSGGTELIISNPAGAKSWFIAEPQ